MYPHVDANRRRRVGQLSGQMPPQHSPHMMGMTQQAPGVMLPVRNQPVQILQQGQHHYSSPQQFQNPPNSQQQYINSGPPPIAAQYRPQPQAQQHYPHNSTQVPVVLTKQAVNHNKQYREDYKVINEGLSSADQNPPNSYTNYHQQQYEQPRAAISIPQPVQNEVTMANPMPPVEPEKKDQQQGDESAPSPDSTTKDVTPTAVVGMKEKTPMCLVNELARFNKITHQYRLTNEQGPAHKKSFTVTLTLGREEYTADGPSIKKAQHAAAADALTKTTYTHPAPKNNKFLPMGNMTPTVELNALAMKRGEPASYKLIEYPSGQTFQPQQSYGYRRPYGIRGGGFYGRGRGMNDRGGRGYGMRSNYGPASHYGVSLKVGDKEFLGEGSTPQIARHDAASKALAHLRLLPTPENAADSSRTPENEGDPDLDSSIKSPISLVHEVALKRNLNVIFNVISEKGPPHMKIFITECIVGEFKSEGEGNGKKISKKRAAENMLQELKKLPPLSPSLVPSVAAMSRLKRKPPQTKKKTRNLIKLNQEAKPEVEVPEEMNPISRLIQIQQVKKEREPVYTLLEEKGMHRRREFVMEVAIGELKATGTGPNKKVAKKHAAQALLSLIEGKPAETSNETATTAPTKEEKVKVSKPEGPSGSGGRQLAPGLLLVNDQQKFTTPPEPKQSKGTSGGSVPAVKVYPKGFGPKDQLLYLSKLLNIEVNFADYPKANHSKYLTLLSLGTDPSQVCHGSAATLEEAHNEAASTALKALSAMGLDCGTSLDKNTGGGGEAGKN